MEGEESAFIIATDELFCIEQEAIPRGFGVVITDVIGTGASSGTRDVDLCMFRLCYGWCGWVYTRITHMRC